MEHAYVLTVDFRGHTYAARGESFNDAWAKLSDRLPNGEPGDTVDIDDAGASGGSFRWVDDAWVYHNVNSLGQKAG
jgi:hypothetical protein